MIVKFTIILLKDWRSKFRRAGKMLAIKKSKCYQDGIRHPATRSKKEGLLLPEEESDSEVQEDGNEAALSKLQQLIEARAVKSRNPQALRELFAKMAQENDKAKIAEILVSEINQRKDKPTIQ